MRMALRTALSTRRSRKRSSAIDSAMPGRCTLMATSEPSGRRPRYTWPRLAAAMDDWEISAKRLEMGAPSSVLIRRMARASLKGGIRSWAKTARRWRASEQSGTKILWQKQVDIWEEPRLQLQELPAEINPDEIGSAGDRLRELI